MGRHHTTLIRCLLSVNPPEPQSRNETRWHEWAGTGPKSRESRWRRRLSPAGVPETAVRPWVVTGQAPAGKRSSPSAGRNPPAAPPTPPGVVDPWRRRLLHRAPRAQAVNSREGRTNDEGQRTKELHPSSFVIHHPSRWRSGSHSIGVTDSHAGTWPSTVSTAAAKGRPGSAVVRNRLKRQLRELWTTRRETIPGGCDYVLVAKPDAVVLIDYPGFNWHIARKAQPRRGTKRSNGGINPKVSRDFFRF